MEFFSWKTSDTNETIWNIHSGHNVKPVKMTVPDGREYVEEGYNGYGVFGGVDFFDLVADLNNLIPIGQSKRSAAIKFYFSDANNKILPKLVSINYVGKWEDLNDSKLCSTQGFYTE